MFPENSQVHNANTLGASLLARTYCIRKTKAYRDLAQKSIQYTAQYQRADGSWYYGEKENLHWVDNFHTAYVSRLLQVLLRKHGRYAVRQEYDDGYEYWKNTFFLADGTPILRPQDASARYSMLFSGNRHPVFFTIGSRSCASPESCAMDHRPYAGPSGYFYYRRYSPWLVNKTPTFIGDKPPCCVRLPAFTIALIEGHR